MVDLDVVHNAENPSHVVERGIRVTHRFAQTIAGIAMPTLLFSACSNQTAPPTTDVPGSCLPADREVAAYRARLAEPGVTLTDPTMVRSGDPALESWYFVSARVVGGPHDGAIATWAIPGHTNGDTDLTDTADLSVPANDTANGFAFGDRRLSPAAYGASEWMDLDGAIASQRCVSMGDNGR